MKSKRLISMLATAMLALPGVALATNGYFSHGYGTISKGLAGGGSALPEDAMISATNPAGLVDVGNQIDLGMALFSPKRGYCGPSTNTFPVSGPGGSCVNSHKNLFEIPSFAVSYMLDADSSVGLAVYGNGGMNSTYLVGDTAGAAGTFGGGRTGVDMMQLFVNASYSRKLNKNLSVGAGVIFAAQRFDASGFSHFAPFSTDPADLSDKGFDYSYGGGLKFGIQDQVLPSLALAASYQTRIYMGKFKKYKGLFAQGGGFDIPPTATVGLAWKVTPASTVTFDVQKTWFSQVASVGNPMDNLSTCAFKFPSGPGIGSTCLGGSNGAGFGWKDMTVYKLGYQWRASPNWTWRVGYSKTRQPITQYNVLFNIVAPAVVDQHYTIGFTHRLTKRSDLNFAAFYAPKKTVTGDGGPYFAPGTGLGMTSLNSVKIYMHEYEVEASWSYRF